MYIICTTLLGRKKLIKKSELEVRKSVYAIIIDQEQILLVNTKSTGKLWFPGGVVEDGETEQEALEREIYEETGVTAKIKKNLANGENFFYYDLSNKAYHQFSSFYLAIKLEEDKNYQNPDQSDEVFDPTWKKINQLTTTDFQDYGFEIFDLVRNSTSDDI